jgi:hypothetical protein
MPSPVVVLLVEVPYLVRRGRPDVPTGARRKVVDHTLEFRLSQPDEHTLQRVLRFPGFPISSICRSLSSIALLWLGAGTPRSLLGIQQK